MSAGGATLAPWEEAQQTSTPQLAPWEEAAQAKPQTPAAAPVQPQPAGQLPNGTVSAAPEPGYLQRVGENVRNSAVGRALGMEPTLHEGPEATHARQSLPDVLPQWAEKPLLQPDTSTPLGKIQTQQAEQFRQQHPVAGGIVQGVQDVAQGLSTPANLALLLTAPELKPLSALFAAQAAKGAYSSAEDAYQAFRQGKNGEAAKFATESGLNAVIAGLAGTHAARGSFPVDAARPTVSEPSVVVPPEPRGLPSGPQPEYVGEPPAPPQAAGIPDAEVTPWEEAAKAEKPVMHATNDVEELRKSAERQAPKIGDAVKSATEQVPGAKLEAVRDSKDTGRIEDKAERQGVQPSQIGDIAAAKVVVPDQAAAEKVLQNLNGKLPVEKVEGSVDGEPGKNGVQQVQAIVDTQAPGEPVKKAEVLIQTPEMAKATDETHDDYRKAQDLHAQGKDAEADKIESQIQQVHEEAQAPLKVGDAIEYQTNKGKTRVGKIERIEGDRAQVRDSFATVWKPLTAITRPSNQGAKGEVGQQPTEQNQPVPAQVAQGAPSVPEVAHEQIPEAKGDKWIGVDLDGTLAHYDGFKGKTVIGEPVPEMLDRVKRMLAEGNNVKILTARVSDDPGGEGKKAIQDWIEQHLGQRLDVTDVKDSHMTHLYDDRAVPVERNTGKLLAQPQPEEPPKPWEEAERRAAPTPEGQPRQRRDTATRPAIETMKSEDLAREVAELRSERTTDELTGIGNLRGFKEAQAREKAPIVGASDSDGMAAFNDRFGHAAGDELLKAKANALKQVGLEAYRTGGDEFLYRGKNEADLKAKLDKARDILRNTIFDLTMKDGSTVQLKGVDFSYGTGSDVQAADKALYRHKDERTQAGERAPKGSGQFGRGVEIKPREPEKREGETKFKFGNTQADIPGDSEAAKALVAAQKAIDPADLAGDVNGTKGGMEETPHVTVRYGIKGEDTAGIRAYIESQPPFEASLGKTIAFPPSEHSDGAAPIVAPVESADLRRMEAELDKHGDFKERSFPEYKPHATVAYVKADEAKRYTGMTETEGKKFTVTHISITGRDGEAESVQLKGKAHAEPRNGGEPRAADEAEGGGREDALQERSPEKLLQRQPEETGGQGGGRVQPGQQGNEPTREGAPKEAPLEQPKEEVKPKPSFYKAASVIPFRRPVEAQTGDADAGFIHAADIQAGGDQEKAKELYEGLLKNHPDHAPTLLNLGTILFHERDFSGAEKLYRRAVEVDPDYSMAHFNLGNALDELHRPDEAISAYKKALYAKEPHLDAHYNLALMLEQKNPIEALRHWQSYAKLDRSGAWSDYAHSRIKALLRGQGLEIASRSDAGGKAKGIAPLSLVTSKSEPIKTEAKAVAPGTAEPTAHEQKVAELERLNQQVERITKEMSASGTNDFRGLKKLGNQRDAFKKQIETIKKQIAESEREAVQIAKREAIPVTKPEEQLVTDPDKNKWKYQGEYFVKALEPAKQAWLGRMKGAFGDDAAEQWKYLVKHDPGGKSLPKEFPNEFIRIEVPGDGKFLVVNKPAAIDKLLRSAPSAFAKPSATIPGETKRSVPRAPKELDTAKLIQQYKAEIEETEQDLKRAETKDKQFLQEKLDAARENLAEAERAGTDLRKSGTGIPNESDSGERYLGNGDAASGSAGEGTTAGPRERSDDSGLRKEIPARRSDLGSTTYSGGFLDPELFKTLFPSVAERLKDWITDTSGPGEEQRAMMRETRGEKDRMIAIVAKKLQPSQRSWIFRSREDSQKFFNAVEEGRLEDLPEKDRALAQAFKGAFDKMKEEIQDLKPDVLQSYIENYFPHIWKHPSMAASTIRAVIAGRRPFAGKGSFLRQRTIPTIQDGIDMGLTPVSWNPVDLFLQKYAEMAQWLFGQKTLQMSTEAGTAKMVRVGQKPPEGWGKIDDRIGTVYGRDTTINPQKVEDATYDKQYMGGKRPIPSVAREDLDEAMREATVIRGYYYMPAPAAKVFNNYVSRGLAGRSGIYDTLRWANNNLNSLQLGISAFHASTTAINAATSEVALGIQQLFEGKPIRAVGHMISGFGVAPSIIRTMVNGSRMMEEYLKPGSYRKLAAEASAVAMAGGRAKMDFVQMKALDKTINAFRNGAVGEGLLSIPGTVLQTTIAPVMDWLVPRMKLGAFYDMAHDIFDQAGRKGWSEDEVRAKMQRAWDSVDNRFGQLVYENLFWHRALQDTLMLASRSVGWNFGDLRELGGAAKDTAQQAGKAAQGKMPEVTPRMAFAFALPLVTGLIGAVLTYLWTGKGPDTWKDYFYPKRQDGTRVSIPGYMKDVVAFKEHPINTITNKMSPIAEMTAEAINNRDFYGTEIRHQDDAPVKQFLQVAKWAGQQAKPFSLSGTQKLLQKEGEDTSTLGNLLHAAGRHVGDLALGQLGFQPAPAYIQHSDALNKAYEYNQANRPSGTKTQAQADRTNAMHTVEDMYRRKAVNRDTIAALKSQGKLTETDLLRAKLYARTDPLVAASKSLSAEQMLNVYAVATPEEKKTLRPLVELKDRELNKETDPEKRQQLRDAYRTALYGQRLKPTV